MSESLPLPASNISGFVPGMFHSTFDAPAVPAKGRGHAVTMEWLAVAERVAQVVDLDVTAHAKGAMLRRRGVPAATNLLALVLMYGPGGMSLRQVADRAASADIAHVSEPALLRRLLNASAWLELVVDQLLIERLLTLSGDSLADDGMGLNLRSYAVWQHAAQSAKHFLVDFIPWSDDSFNEAQEHWLLCARWNFVASTIQDGPMFRSEPTGVAPSTLERMRMLAHLLVALLPTEA